MAVTSGVRLVNPRLGTYFGIFAAAFASLVLMALMLEQLGVSDMGVRLLMFAGPIALCGALGLLTPASDPNDYFACGRRVPAFFNGLVLAITALGGAGLMALTGAFFTVGFDALCLSLGISTGLVFMGVLLAPFLRKSGDYTVPSFLGRRFESRPLRIVAAAVLAVPLLLLLAAEAGGAVRFLRRGLADGPAGAHHGGCGGRLRLRHGVRRWHALAHLVGVGQGHRRPGRPGGAGHHRRPHGL
jgi:cation/acetate symporter